MPIKKKYLKKKQIKTFDMKGFIQVKLIENDEKSKSESTFIQALCITWSK